jgi:hypothetical protein
MHPTADDRVLPAGTAFMTDVGMTADYDSIIGMNKDEPLNRFLRKLPGAKFEASSGPATLCGFAVETDDASGLARQGRRRSARRYPAGGAAEVLGMKFSIARLTANRGDDSLDDVDSPACAWVRHSDLGTGFMNLQVNANLALELPPDLACQTSDPEKKTDRRVELAAQFIPAGARVFDLSEGTALQVLPAEWLQLPGIDRPLARIHPRSEVGRLPDQGRRRIAMSSSCSACLNGQPTSTISSRTCGSVGTTSSSAIAQPI